MIDPDVSSGAAFGVAVAQFAPGPDSGINVAAMRELARTAVARGARLIVFPEYSAFFEPVMGPSFVAAAQPLDGPFVMQLAGIARELGIHVVAGMLESTTDTSRFSNTIVALDPAGALVAKYRKLHLYDAFGDQESRWVLPGTVEEPETFDVGGLRAGLQTCYDIRFPEVTRRLVDAGADLVLVPAEWVRGPLKEAHWRTLVTARALENTVYVAAADHAPPVGAGNSMVVDPMGVELVTIGETTDVAVAWAAPGRVRAVRALNPAVELRRFAVVPR
ncbi:carbon-nitrogen hydrolase family protein [Cryobacterium sp. TMT1-21]|uniref:Carbon-nitrogen hydrolase family protein n=1 Tax=Cryobacterium shii TaxID=1259235 RepID=A0AAQ2HGA2_9MICO|nr:MULTISPECIES: carbon-nitrogen hydrolase family protein [Cryobacterium]TFC50180.1 carbon-nitrogen hydrolase family protein [Cryobacterium shii]TFC83170.1 carbon-nitrogen hydrolase family protein [Cryobacterium sp. TmT2-59]TFD17981.1 carbon-nitrogen hydrolase family protein [Cryobacterium sp. TMT4-10]TFD18131.1 carbon-nitrogen hydrolase family protein [Cryobacterium sp. TMT1-21]TFD25001.1 carbon-nitrogen hydrolase family protein [Cryobacterium sp. TMT2-23]